MSTKAIKSSSVDKRWEEDNDARTLAEAEAIRTDKKRLLGASRGAKRLIKDKRNELKGYEKVARKTRSSKRVKGGKVSKKKK